MTQYFTHPASAPFATASAPASKADPSVDFRELGMSSYSGEMDKTDAEIMAAMLPAHPRAFWGLAKNCLFESSYSRDTAHRLATACANDERLIRLGISAMRNRRGHYETGNSRLIQFLGFAMKLPDKSDAWREARISDAKPILKNLSACTVFEAVGLAARAGRLAAAESLARLMPDSELGEKEAKRYRYGRCGFASQDFGDDSARAWARASILAESCGVDPKPQPENMGREPANPLFWIAHRHAALRESDPAAAAAWDAAGAEMIRRGVEVEAGSKSVSAAMSAPQMLAALAKRRPLLGSPSFYSFDREAATYGALSLAKAEDVEAICAYEETSDACKRSVEVSINGAPRILVAPIPAAALALLAGHKPDPAWLSMGADRSFKIPQAVVEKAKLGELSEREVADISNSGRGVIFTNGTLAAALAKAPKPAKPKAKIKQDDALAGSEPAPAKPRSPKAKP